MKHNVAVIGLGYVGYPLAVLAAKKGHQVTAIDVSKTKVSLVNAGKSPLAEEPADPVLRTDAIRATTDFSAVAQADFVIICVPTPIHHNKQPDLSPVKSACLAIAEHLQKGTTIVLESTVNPGVSEEVILPLIEESSGLVAGKDFQLSHCPERINPGDAKWKVHNIPRVVGSYTPLGLKKTVAFYQSIIEGNVVPMQSLKEAEAVKIVENSFRDVNIAFVNELAMSFDVLGINTKRVIDAAATKPFAFMAHYPGCGVGGHCIPVDPYYLIEYARGHGFEHQLLVNSRRINGGMPAYAISRLFDALNDVQLAISGTNVTVLGLSYKANIADMRESPVLEIIDLLKSRNANVTVFDPYVLEQSNVKSLDAALKGAQAVILATAHEEFLGLSVKELQKAGIVAFVDGRNAFDPEEFKNSSIVYRGIGVA